MPDLGHILPLSGGMTPGAYGIYLILLTLALRYLKEWRETRKLSLDDRLARREGYAKQVENLQAENRLVLSDLHELRKEYDEHRRLCFAETDQLRQHVQRVEDENAGLKRNYAVLSIEMAKLKGVYPPGFPEAPE